MSCYGRFNIHPTLYNESKLISIFRSDKQEGIYFVSGMPIMPFLTGATYDAKVCPQSPVSPGKLQNFTVPFEEPCLCKLSYCLALFKFANGSFNTNQTKFIYVLGSSSNLLLKK